MTKKESQTEITELQEQLARVSADYANYRRRTEEEKEIVKKRAAQQLTADILAVTDNLQLALSQANTEDGLYKGVELILGQLMTVLESHGVQKISTEGSFDPTKHEALLSEHNEAEENTIIDVLQNGYELGGVILRTAKVKVSKGPKEEQKHE